MMKTKRTVFILTLLLTTALALLPVNAQEVHIPDAELASAIREALGLGEGARITVAAMRELTELAAGGRQIADLTGLEHAINLMSLNLYGTGVSDISALAGLTKLESLGLGGTDVWDISALANLTQLKWLTLHEIRVWDISALAGLTKLESLYLADTDVSDISALANLPNLEYLGLYGCPLSDASLNTHIPALQAKGITVRFDQHVRVAVRIPDVNLASAIREALGLGKGEHLTPAAMRELTELGANGWWVTDLTGLEHATQLEELNLSHTGVSGISALANLTNLRQLSLQSTNVSDISALANLTNLERLVLVDCPLNNASLNTHIPALQAKGIEVEFGKSVYIPDARLARAIRKALGGARITVAAMRELTELETGWIEDLTGLEHATQLETLSFRGRVSDISVLAKLTNLRELDLSRTNVSDISALANLTQLTYLNLGSYHRLIANLSPNVSDISALANLTQLTYLHLARSAVSDISVLANLTNLRELDLSGTNVSDISVLANLTNLETLGLYETDVSDISVLANLTNLERLGLYETDVSDISVLANLTNLRELDLSFTGVSDISALVNLLNLRELDLINTKVRNISVLANLTNLETLDLQGTDVSDIFALANLTNLKTLNLVDCRLNRAAGHTHIPALQARGTEVGFWADMIARGCGALIPANLEPLEPVRIEPITQKQQIVSEGDFQGATVKFAPQVDNGESRAWATWATVVGQKYGSLGAVVITAKILNGTAEQKAMIKRAAAEWERNGNLFFHFVESGEADVRIFIDTKKESDGGWAHIGTSATGTDDPAMTLYNEFSYGTCLHEFGHVLGLTHEHLSPRFLDLVEWAYEGDELIAKIREEGFSDWSEKKIRDNILTPRGVGPAAKFDPDSIMTYGISSHLLKARPNAPNPTLANEIATNGVPDNDELSADDKGLLRHIYGPPGQKAVVEGSISIDGVDDETGKVTWKRIKAFGVTVGWRPVWKDDETINETESFGPQFFSSVDEYVLASGPKDPARPRNPDARFKWGGECRVEVYLSTRKIVAGKHIEMAASVFLFEGTTEDSSDLEDFKCVDFDVPFYGSNEVTLKLNNKFWGNNDRPLLAIDTRARQCREIDIDVRESWLSLEGDVLGGGDWAEVTISLSAKPIGNVSDLLAAAKAAAAPAAATVKHRPSQELSDVNGDGQVTVADLVLVSNHIGQSTPSDSRVDLNADGIVTIVDLVRVAQHLGQSTDPAAPAHIVAPRGLAYETVEGWLNRARAADDGSRPFRQGLTNLERLLVLIIPEKMALLPNYPNPFNPETWIPYHLAEAAEVTLTLYTVDGKVVRTLALGHQSAGFYQSRSRAAYWDGRNEVGERVASGVYFYTLSAGDFSATRKLVIRK